jgi:hypothetical protein
VGIVMNLILPGAQSTSTSSSEEATPEASD